MTSSAPCTSTDVERHYDTLASSQRLSAVQRRALPTHALRNVQNRIKEYLIEQCGRRSKVYDACCGRGGDMAKYARHTKPDVIVFADLSQESINEVSRRYTEACTQNDRWALKHKEIHFRAMDCFKTSATDTILYMEPDDPNDRRYDDEEYGPPMHPVPLIFDLIVCNMALHYAFETHESATRALCTLASSLEPIDGVLLCTVPDVYELAQRSANFTINEFGNKYYKVQFIVDTDVSSNTIEGDNPTKRRRRRRSTVAPLKPRAYRFSLQGAVDNCIEYVIEDTVLRTACVQAGLEIVSSERFVALVMRTPHLLRLYEQLPHEQREVVSLYRAFFICRSTSK